MLKTNVFKQLANNPLILTPLSEQGVIDLVKKTQAGNIFFGAGIMTHNQLSNAVPFDILGFFFTAEQLRRVLHSQTVFVFIAEQHAFSNKLFPEKLITQRTNQTMKIVNSIITNFHLSHFKVIRTSDLQQVASIKKIFREQLPQMENEYLKHEITDVLWLNRFHHVKLKLGWAMSSQQSIQGHDERFFDHEIKKFCPQVEFLHLKPGRTFDAQRPRVSPYISVKNETRILLQPRENVKQKLAVVNHLPDREVVKATVRHLSQIVRLHDSLFAPLQFMSFEEKLQTILDRAVRENGLQ